MQRYADISGSSGISRYQVLEQGIILEFKTGRKQYLYTYLKPGKAHVEEMKRLALAGHGLATYVNQYVRDKFERRIK